MRFFLKILAFATGVLISAAQDKTSQQIVATPGKFVDVTSALGLHFQHLAPHTSKKYLLETMGSGVALFDYDNDGRLDLFLVNGAEITDPTPLGTIPKKTTSKYWNRLYHQKPDGSFEDVTERAGLQGAGYGMGAAVGDYDNDGNEDGVCHRIWKKSALSQQW
jgi:enediyne biosynthesis protein E4